MSNDDPEKPDKDIPETSADFETAYGHAADESAPEEDELMRQENKNSDPYSFTEYHE